MINDIGVAVVGDVLDINTWSNTPWYFYHEGARQGLFNQPWRLDMNKFSTSRKIWNATQMLSGKGKGGYQYSESFLDKAEAMIKPSWFSSTVISMNQVFPRARKVTSSGGQIYYYVDMTLADLFAERSYNVNISETAKRKALEIEKENYERAAGVVSMATWVHTSLKDFYKLPAGKIHAIMPGANLPLETVGVVPDMKDGAGITRNLRLGFIGKDWKRKGLLTLLDARDLLEQKGYKVNVIVIGPSPEELTGRRGVEFTGFIDKRSDHQKFIEVIRGCDVGCLFSESEALGISVLEFLSVGVPVIGYAHQGTLDTLIPGASVRFTLKDGADTIAQRLSSIIDNPPELRSLRERARSAQENVTWKSTINQWAQLLNRRHE